MKNPEAEKMQAGMIVVSSHLLSFPGLIPIEPSFPVCNVPKPVCRAHNREVETAKSAGICAFKHRRT